MEVYTYIGICIFGVTLPPLVCQVFCFCISRVRLLPHNLNIICQRPNFCFVLTLPFGVCSTKLPPLVRVVFYRPYTLPPWFGSFFFAIRTVWSLLQNLSIISWKLNFRFVLPVLLSLPNETSTPAGRFFSGSTKLISSDKACTVAPIAKARQCSHHDECCMFRAWF